jgi:hypothetical protein
MDGDRPSIDALLEVLVSDLRATLGDDLIGA